MQVTGFGYTDEDEAFARVAKGSDWNLEFPTPYSALKIKDKYKNYFLLVSTIEQGGRMRYQRIKLKEKKKGKEEEKEEENKDKDLFSGFQMMSATNRGRVSF